MPVTFHLPPARILRAPAQNPAEIFAQSGAVEMGFTEPRYNGKAITAVGNADALTPTVAVNRANIIVGGVTYLSSAQVTALPNHQISWPMNLPPNPVNGMWTALNKVSGLVITERLNAIVTSRRRAGANIKANLDPQQNPRLISARTQYRFHFKLEPDAATFMHHVEYHELQHAADHKWLAERVIGWWDVWLGELLQNQITVVSSSPSGLDTLAKGFDYSTVGQKIILYWCRVADYSGDLYHDTDEGAPPVLNIEQVTGEDVFATIRPKRIIYQKPDLNNPRPHREMQVKTRGIDGTEARLEYGSSSNPFLQIPLARLDATHWQLPV